MFLLVIGVLVFLAIKAQGEAYKLNPELIDLKKTEISAETSLPLIKFLNNQFKWGALF